MADPGIVAGRQLDALKRANDVLPRLAKAMGMDTEVSVPVFVRDKAIEQARQMEFFADFLEKLVDSVEGKVKIEDIEKLVDERVKAAFEGISQGILKARESSGESIPEPTIVATDTADGDTMLVQAKDGAFVEDLPDVPFDYDGWTKADLADHAEALGVEVNSRMTKAELIDLLKEADDGSHTADK